MERFLTTMAIGDIAVTKRNARIKCRFLAILTRFKSREWIDIQLLVDM
jgi:hypothetical protein